MDPTTNEPEPQTDADFDETWKIGEETMRLSRRDREEVPQE